jgi:hypothetical protein
VGEEDIYYLQDEMVKVKFFLAMSRGTFVPFQISIFPFSFYQTTRQTLHHFPRSFICKGQIQILFKKIVIFPVFLVFHVSVIQEQSLLLRID